MKAEITITFKLKLDVPNEYYPVELTTDEDRLAHELEMYENGTGDIMLLISQDSEMKMEGKVLHHDD